MEPPDSSNHPYGGDDLSPFEKFLDEASKGNLLPELLADLPGLSSGQLEELLCLLRDDPKLSVWYPYKLILKGRGLGRPPLNPVERHFEAREVHRQVMVSAAKAESITAAIEEVSDARGQSVSLVSKLYGKGKPAAAAKKSPP